MDLIDTFNAAIAAARQAQTEDLTSEGEALGLAFELYHGRCEDITKAFAKSCADAENALESALGLRRMMFMGELEPPAIMPRSSHDPDAEAKARIDIPPTKTVISDPILVEAFNKERIDEAAERAFIDCHINRGEDAH